VFVRDGIKVTSQVHVSAENRDWLNVHLLMHLVHCCVKHT